MGGRGDGMGMGFTNGNQVQRDPTTHPKFRTKPCRYFASGGCKNGERCTFLHVELTPQQFAAEFGSEPHRPGKGQGGPYQGGSHQGGSHQGGSHQGGSHQGHGGGGGAMNGRLPGLGGPLQPFTSW